MAATLQLSVTNGNGPTGTPTDGVSGIDLISADNATNTLANRQANPITVGTRSYEKWIRLKITSTPSNAVGTFLIWGDGTVMSSTTLWWSGNITSYSTPTSGTGITKTNFTLFTANAKGTWDTRTNLFTVGTYTNYSVFQLEVGSDAGPGTWTQETINYSYDEL